MTQNGDKAKNDAARSVAIALTAVYCALAGIVAGAMISSYYSAPVSEVDSPTLVSLRLALEKNPGSAELKDAVRNADLEMRRAYFATRRRIRTGALLLVAFVGGAVASARKLRAMNESLPRPRPLSERQDEGLWMEGLRRNRIAVSVAGIALVALVVGIALTHQDAPNDVLAPTPDSVTSVNPVPTPDAQHAIAAEDFVKNWPRFRGHDGNGRVSGGNWPTEWNLETGKNVLWTVDVPAPGHGSPIAWDDRIFLTGATEEGREVMCFNMPDGRLLWRTKIEATVSESEEVKVLEQTGYAAATPATDGKRVYAIFANGDVAAVDADGKVVWARNLCMPQNAYGIASSLLVYRNMLIVQMDQGSDAEDGLSFITALDLDTGRDVWRTKRATPNTWTTPIIISADGRDELVTVGKPLVVAYNPLDGKELWKADCMGGEVAVSPVFNGKLVYVTNEHACVAAIRPGGSGDVTETNVAWQAEEGMSDTSSPVVNEKFFLQVHSSGYVTCYDAVEGKLLWEHELDSPVWASPALVGDVVYLPCEDGKVFLFRMAGEYSQIGMVELGEPLYASPAFVNGKIIFRGKKRLFCVGTREVGK
ncbi:MAG TPA: PQQ-binding-like beta-propeller repeat protein [Candidatus Brocadiia bacterium]|nr:PQQ-binding-like beta-propeller repeat protein [Candidatus Brocadiia bacterium]